MRTIGDLILGELCGSKKVQIWRDMVANLRYINITSPYLSAQQSGDSGFESRAGLITSRWPNGKAPDYGAFFLVTWSCSCYSLE